jgi:AraC-like DNA-binding protein
MQNNYKLLLALKAEKSNVDIHKHSAFQIVFTEDNPFLSTIENKKHNEIFGFAIKPQVAHSCECSQSNLIILNIEPYSFLGKFISTKLGQSNFAVFTNKMEFQDFFESTKTEFSLTSLISQNYNLNIVPIDERVLKAISLINEQFKEKNISTQDIAKQFFISPSRLATVFKEQTGSSISKYLLWTRLRNAIFLILTEKDTTLTKIALESGFYDSSQMIKYMYQMFGISPSKLKQKSDLIQFLEI